MAFKIDLFDFTANDFSRSFEPWVKSNETFSKQFRSFLKEKPKEPMTPTDLDGSFESLAASVEEHNMSMPALPVFAVKRSAINLRSAPMPEVESLLCVWKDWNYLKQSRWLRASSRKLLRQNI